MKPEDIPIDFSFEKAKTLIGTTLQDIAQKTNLPISIIISLSENVIQDYKLAVYSSTISQLNLETTEDVPKEPADEPSDKSAVE